MKQAHKKRPPRATANSRIWGNYFINLNSPCKEFSYTAHLTDASQILNLDELARVANKYELSVRVIGAADSSTRTSGINNSLSTS